tara:strand:- start:122 stop:319 length:198 start_codon:yes stop_codon:yes gene_type:complete
MAKKVTKVKSRKARPTRGWFHIRWEKEKGLSAVAKCQKKGGKLVKGRCVTKYKEGSPVKDPISKR